MLFSISVLSYLIIIQLFANNYRNANKEVQYLVLFISFIILNVFRIYGQSTFPDVEHYNFLFESINPIIHLSSSVTDGRGILESNTEIGFTLFISIFKLFSKDYGFFLFVVSLIELSVFYYFCRKYKISMVNSFPVYFSLTYITFQIGMIRQALAFCFLLIALVYIERKKTFILFVLLGFLFHQSMIIGLLLLWSDKYIKRNIIYAIFLGSLILYIYQIDIAQFIDDYIYSGKLFRIERIRYYTYDVWRPNNYLGIGFWERILLFILINLAYTDLLRKNKINRYNNVIYNLGVSVILLQLIYFSNPTITSRIRYYIVIFPIIFLSEYIYSETSNKMLKWLYLPALFAYLYMYTRFLSSYLA